MTSNGNDIAGGFARTYWQTAETVDVPLTPLDTGSLDDAAFRLLAENLPTLCWLANGDGYIVWYNRRWYDYTGTTPEQMEGWGWTAVHDPARLPEVMEGWRTSIATGDPFEMTFPLRGADGVFRPFLTRVVPIRDASGTVQRWCGVNTKIADQIAAEEALREQQERLRLVVEGAVDHAILTLDLHRCVTSWSPGAASAFGWTADEVIGHSADILFTPEDRVAGQPEREVAIALSDGVSPDVRWHQRKDGGRVFLNGSMRPLHDAHGRHIGFHKIARDETERQRRDEALRETEERYRLAARATNDAIWDWRIADGHVVWNEALGTLFDHPDRETDADWRIEHIHPDDRTRVSDSIHHAIDDDGTTWSEEYRFRRADGSYAHVLDRGTVLRDESGRAIRMIGAMLDLTERRRLYEQLRANEARLLALTRASSDALYRMSPDWGEMRELSGEGFLSEVSDPSRAWLMAFIPLDEQARVTQAIDEAIARKASFDLEHRVVRADGSIGWTRSRAVPMLGDDGEIVEWFGAAADVTARIEAEQGLRRLNDTLERRVADALAERKLLADIVEGTDAFVQVAGPDYRWLAINRAAADEFEAIYGVRPRVGDDMLALLAEYPDHQAAVKAVWSRALAGESFTEIGEFGDPGRARRHYEMKYDVLRNAEGQQIGAYQFVYDVSQRVRDQQRLIETEEQLRQAQKMEAVGQLTGGIAHDFNNLLTGVIGSLDMMQRRIARGETDKVDRYATAAITSANRAAALTHRLLAFSRRQPLDPKPVNANKLVSGMEELLRRTIGESIRLEIVTAGGLWQTLCDPHQLESAILNLAINARDAMPGGGQLTIETCNAHLDNAYAAQQREVTPGQYVCICVTDTGTGMSADVIGKAFEPFFTTKPIGQGTGLGLSMIYGFARQSEGYAKIYSEQRQGTTVKLYLPRYYGEAEDAESAAAELTDAHRSHHGEVVLVVEDETAVRDLVVDVLGELGYHAVEAVDGPSGLRLLQSDMRLDLLVTDVGLPGLNGRQLADAARAHRPDLKVLFMTGYAENATIANGFLDPGMAMITKPFAVEALATRIRDMIENA